jgi:hypothetical protein
MEKDKGESMEEDEGQTALINTQDLWHLYATALVLTPRFRLF